MSKSKVRDQSQAQPGPLWQAFERLMQLSPQAFPFEQCLQHFAWTTPV
ncbi:hypothetical protein [Thioclava marina]|nr:hypothetical protein [Thioclava marina]